MVKKTYEKIGDLGTVASSAKGSQRTLGFGMKPKPATTEEVLNVFRQIVSFFNLFFFFNFVIFCYISFIFCYILSLLPTTTTTTYDNDDCGSCSFCVVPSLFGRDRKDQVRVPSVSSRNIKPQIYLFSSHFLFFFFQPKTLRPSRFNKTKTKRRRRPDPNRKNGRPIRSRECWSRRGRTGARPST